jgi:D-alanyl-D-alanine carboxypeptidase/D-alanyl-D-alanine-endopeptidase (penicillin-binding protein 4)
MKRLLLLSLIVTACAPAATRAPAAPRTLASVADSVIRTPPLDRTHWGILVVDAATGRELYRHDARAHYIPASNTKLVVTAVALGTLGPEYRYRTPVRAHGMSGDSVQAIVVHGTGDPTLSARFHRQPLAAIDSVARAIAATGIRAAQRLVIDVSAFEDERINGSWEVGDLPWSYAPPTSAFGIEEGTFRIVVQPGPGVGAPAVIRVLDTDAQPVSASILTDTAGARTRLTIDYMQRTDTVFITGHIAVDAAADTSTLAVTRPEQYAAHVLREALARRGVSIAGIEIVDDSVTAAQLRTGGTVIHEIVSPPMRDIVAAILQPSQNWIAEQVLKTLGAVYRGSGSWDAGLEVEREYLVHTAGLDSMSFSLRDGSGLSAQNLLAPEAIIRLLAHARTQPWADDYRAGMAQPGLQESTLANRLRALEGRMFAKTGTIANVNSLSGYLVTDDGRELLFSILTNGSGRSPGAVRAGIDRIAETAAGGGS